MQLKLHLPMTVSINKLYVNEYKWDAKSRSRIPTGRRILSKDGMKNKAMIQGSARIQMQGQNWDFDWTKENYVYQDAIFYFARRGTDDNNQYKILNDSLEGVAYDNDSRVLVRTQRIVYSPDDPHIELILTPVDFKGIFENDIVFDEFEDTCKDCSKYRKGSCSILKDSIDGTVREEIGSIHNPKCTAFKEKK